MSATGKRSIGFAVSGIKHYENAYYQNSRSSFAALSLTGLKCSLSCAHCGGILLQSMPHAETAEKFITCVDKIVSAGCKGVLVSGGCGPDGSVPVLPSVDGIAYAKNKGLKVVVHTGLVDRKTAFLLKEAGVDQVLMDVIGSEKTIRNVYGINRTPDDYYNSMLTCKEAGIEIAPHIVVGLDYGKIEGEYDAIDLISRCEANSLILVVLTPKRGTAMQDVPPPPLEEVLKVFSYAAENVRNAFINLGCTRPFTYSPELEKAAVDLGFSAIAYPHAETVEYAKTLGIDTFFFEECCSLLSINAL